MTDSNQWPAGTTALVPALVVSLFMACPQVRAARGASGVGSLGRSCASITKGISSVCFGGFSLSSGGCYSLSFPKAASARCLLGALAWLGGRKVLKLPGNSLW